jgi:hypothetical protein
MDSYRESVGLKDHYDTFSWRRLIADLYLSNMVNHLFYFGNFEKDLSWHVMKPFLETWNCFHVPFTFVDVRS